MSRKDALLKAIATVGLGAEATDVQRRAIFSAVAYLEEVNPTPAPLHAPDLLDGDWQLLFTTSRELLGFDRLPGFGIAQIFQCVRVGTGTIYNVLEVEGPPFLEGLIGVCARFTPTSERRVDVRFERAILGLQRLAGYRDIRSFVRVLETGKKLRAIDFAIRNREQRGWLETTYLDADLRIGRGNEGNLFVLRKLPRFDPRA